MLFNSVPFMIFLPIAVLLFYIVPKKYQNIYLLAVSYYFYACFDLRAVPFIAVATLVSFFAAKAIETKEGKARKNAMLLALLVNIGMLLVFKYCNFFAENIVAVANMFGANIEFKRFSLIAVTGISFFTFQSVGYVIDVYLKKIKAEHNLLTYSLFIAFFPHVLAGPISRAAKLMPQFSKEHSFDYENVRSGLQLMAIGFFKKIAVADVLAMFIGAVHNNVADYGGLMLIFTAFAYSIQLYGDFSGYSDIARGSAKLLGFDIVDNFSTPYFSTSFSQFWTKWHISLSSWFQDYIFTPFVWNNPLRRFGYDKPPVIVGIWLVFLTSGLWHGSAWTFIIWGVLHAIYRTGEDLKRKYIGKPDKHPKPLKFWGKVIWVFTLVTFSQIFFRANSVGDAFYYVTHLFSNLSPSVFVSDLYKAVATGFDATPLLIYAYLAFCTLTTAIIVYMDWYRQFRLKGKCLTTVFLTMKQPYRLLCYYILVGLIMAGFIMQNGGYGSSASFIYANF
ncbi:MAG: MBOAT family protein [Oscillospiraceae bacterium]|nr:MBOAT family protein [Oscillospiraceae bacterium]